MIKNDAIGIASNLNYRWENLIEDTFTREFDYSAFRALAVHTFAYLFPYHSAEELPREVMTLLFRIKEFSCCPVCNERYAEYRAAKLVAYELCDQIAGDWIQINSVFDDNRFVARDYDKHYIIDTNTFDLSEVLKDKDVLL